MPLNVWSWNQRDEVVIAKKTATKTLNPNKRYHKDTAPIGSQIILPLIYDWPLINVMKTITRKAIILWYRNSVNLLCIRLMPY